MFYEVELVIDEIESGAACWLVLVPAFPEITTDGIDVEDALLNARKAIEEAIAARISGNQAIPHPLKQTGGKGHFVEVSALIYLKLAIYMIARAKGIKRAEIARNLGWHREQVDRIFRLDHQSRLDQIEAVFKAIGESLTFDIQLPDAA